LILKRRDVRAV